MPVQQSSWTPSVVSYYSHESAPAVTLPHIRRSYTIAKQLYAKLNDNKPIHALADIACGSGGLTFYAIMVDGEHIHKIYANDYVAAFVQQVQHRVEQLALQSVIQTDVLDARQLLKRIPQQSLNCAFIEFALMMIPDASSVLDQVKALLKNGNSLICCTTWAPASKSQFHVLLNAWLTHFSQSSPPTSDTSGTPTSPVLAMPLSSEESINRLFTSCGYEVLHCQPYTAPTRTYESALDFVMSVRQGSPFTIRGTTAEHVEYVSRFVGNDAAFVVNATSFITIARPRSTQRSNAAPAV